VSYLPGVGLVQRFAAGSDKGLVVGFEVDFRLRVLRRGADADLL